MKKFSVEEISQIVGGILTKVEDAKVCKLYPPLLADEETLALALNEEEIGNLAKTKAKIASESRQAEIQLISQTLKALALELKISIIGLSQLNRKVEERGGEPILSDLRESGSIEQDADVVLMLHEIKPSNKNSKNVLEKKVTSDLKKAKTNH